MTLSKTTNKYIFLDRDGTIIEDRGYIHKIKDLKFLPGAIKGLKKLQKNGYRFIIISNQAGIARGLYSLKDAETLNRALKARLAKSGVKIKNIYLCPHHPEFTGKCLCRKPEPGLAKLASKEFKINLRKSIFIGDKDCDIELGKNCGGKTFLIDNGQYETSLAPDHKVKDLEEIHELLKKQSPRS